MSSSQNRMLMTGRGADQVWLVEIDRAVQEGSEPQFAAPGCSAAEEQSRSAPSGVVGAALSMAELLWR